MSNTRKYVLTAMLIALGVVLPQAFHAVPNAGSVFLPMHIPVLISGFAVGPVFGMICGIVTPILSSLIFHMPPAPVLPGMVFELAIYGLMTGLFTKLIKVKPLIAKIYVVLILSMLCGRIGYGLLNGFVLKAGSYSLQTWLAAAFTTALPGIIIQLIVVPLVISALQKARLIDVE